jgi:xylan 1,4-beta-xylosidase
MIAIESILGKLGSRFAINFRPNRGDVRVSALGRFLDYAADLAIGVETEAGVARVLPFSDEAEHFEYVEQELTMNSITFRARSPKAGCLLEVTFTSPFYPRDMRLSTAPFFYVDVRVSAIPEMVHWEHVDPHQPPRGVFFVRVRRGDMAVEQAPDAIAWRYSVPLEGDRSVCRVHQAVEGVERSAECVEKLALVSGQGDTGPEGFGCPFDATAGPADFRFVWAAHVADPVLEAGGVQTSFRYTDSFPTVDAVIEYALKEEATIRRRSRLFDSLFTDSSLSKSQRDFLAYTFQSYLSNTWWTRRPEGSDWFSVWEGVCQFNSTIDVEYNLGLVYFALWPELLELTFQEWETHEQPGGFLSHDMGEGCVANGQSYPHHMEVEENTNFLLMLHAHWRWTGSDAAIRRHFPLVKRLIAYLERADETGNGFPNIGTANTIDDASPAVQYSHEQTYLGVKCLCAFEVTAQIAEHLGDVDVVRRCRERARLIHKTLDAEAWLNDHYVVCIDKDAARLKDVWSGDTLDVTELPGWDAYSLYTSNGMLYPLMVGRALPLDLDRIRTDMLNATRESLVEYGCTHSSADRSNIWVSQNLWRDFTGAYLGIDYLDMAARYWDFLVLENARPEGRCFIDTYVANNLSYYPRGITSIGVLFATLGMRLDRVAGTVSFSPVRVPCRMPLTALADWEAEAIPWVEGLIENGRVMVRVLGELPEGIRLDMPKAPSA